MRKLFLSLVFTLVIGATFMNANSIEKDEAIVNNESIQSEDDFGCASDCNAAARHVALLMSEDHDDRGAGGELMENYTALYALCMEGC